MRRIQYWLIALTVLIPVLAAIGFFRMAAEILAMRSPPLANDNAAIAQATLASWKDNLTMAYLGTILAAFILGRLHALVRRRPA